MKIINPELLAKMPERARMLLRARLVGRETVNEWAKQLGMPAYIEASE